MWAICFLAAAFLRPNQVDATCPTLPEGAGLKSIRDAAKIESLDDVSTPPDSVGNVFLTGLDTGISSASMKCDGTANMLTCPVPSGGASQLIRGDQTCQLKSLMFWKDSDSPTTKGHVTFVYDECTGVPTDAALTLDLAKANGAPTNVELGEFLQEGAGVKTTTPPQSVAKMEMVMEELLIGGANCKGTVLTAYQSDVVPTKAVCRQMCVADIQAYEGQTDAPDVCKGYSFYDRAPDKPEDAVCVTYKGADITNITTPQGPGWRCWKMTPTMQKFKETTAPPPSAAELAALAEKAPKFKATIDQSVAKHATVQTYTSKESCFSSFDWIKMEDINSQPATLMISDAEWEGVMEKIPAAESKKESEGVVLAASIVMDSAVVSQTAVAAAAVAPVTAAPTAAPNPAGAAVVAGASSCPKPCVIPEVINAIITGFMVPIVTWFVVGMLFTQIGKGEDSPGDVPVGCSMQTVLVLMAAAFLCAAILSFSLVTVLGIILKPMCESADHSLVLIRLSCGVTAMVACSMGLFYLSTKHHSAHVANSKDRQYMVVAVEDGKMTHLGENSHVPPHKHKDVMSSSMGSGKNLS